MAKILEIEVQKKKKNKEYKFRKFLLFLTGVF